SAAGPFQVLAEGDGTALVGDGAVAVMSPASRGIVVPLTPDVIPTVESGDQVREGQAVLLLDIPQGESVVLEKTEIEDELVTVRFRYRTRIVCDQPAVVKVGDKVERGEAISKGVIPPQRLMEVAGVKKTQDYLLTELHKVYKSQGVDINDKHFEVVIRQILNNVRIIDPGESNFLLNDVVPLEVFEAEIKRLVEENARIRQEREEIVGDVLLAPVRRGDMVIAEAGEVLTPELLERMVNLGVRQVRVEHHGEPRTVRISEYRLPQGERELLRISRAAILRKSWLAAASFERTTKVLADAALRGEEDPLTSLKPCLMVGKKVPVGTGFVSPGGEVEEDEVERSEEKQL
ncbi:MAG TPA: hypothetical protein ENF15_02805, partial [Candidatus Acetothermia bacterium]|nr:hypothetical protein [Candidatus Acetothermia bacterium]